MYEVNGTKFDLFLPAARAAAAIGALVIEVSTGLVRWSPAPPVSAKRAARYREQQAAYAAQLRYNAQKA